MTVSENIRALAREGMGTAEIARRLGIRYQHAYNVLKAGDARVVTTKPSQCEPSSDLNGALVLVSCVRQKLSGPAPARCLYQSDWFIKARKYVESRNAYWFILSARYGLVVPDAQIAPYEQTLNTAGTVERRIWSENVHRQLAPVLTGGQRVVMLAGQRYREYLVPILLSNGHAVDVPMENLRIGEQLAWLAARV